MCEDLSPVDRIYRELETLQENIEIERNQKERLMKLMFELGEIATGKRYTSGWLPASQAIRKRLLELNSQA